MTEGPLEVLQKSYEAFEESSNTSGRDGKCERNASGREQLVIWVLL